MQYIATPESEIITHYGEADCPFNALTLFIDNHEGLAEYLHSDGERLARGELTVEIYEKITVPTDLNEEKLGEFFANFNLIDDLADTTNPPPWITGEITHVATIEWTHIIGDEETYKINQVIITKKEYQRTSRQRFEDFITSPFIRRPIARHNKDPRNPRKDPPYIADDVELAWQAWTQSKQSY